jgi:hypothetical protein
MSLHLYCAAAKFKNAYLQEAVRLASLSKWDEAQAELEQAKHDDDYAMAMAYVAAHTIKQLPPNTDFLSRLLHQGLDPNTSLPRNLPGSPIPLLGLALCAGNERISQECVRLLIEAGASPLKAQETGYPLLCTALDIESAPLIKTLIEHGIDANDPKERLLLHKHIYYQDAMDLLLSQGMGKDVAEQWAWHVDVQHVPDAEIIVDTLVQHGVNIDAKMRGADNDTTLLEHMVQTNSQFLAELGLMVALIENGASLKRIDADKLIETLQPIMDTHGGKIARRVHEMIEERTPAISARTTSRRI